MAHGESRPDDSRKLELELIRVRAAAEAARLEARAAEIELALLAHADDLREEVSAASRPAGGSPSANGDPVAAIAPAGHAVAGGGSPQPPQTMSQLEAIEALLDAVRRLAPAAAHDESSQPPATETSADGWAARLAELRARDGGEPRSEPGESTDQRLDDDRPILRIDSGQPSPAAPIGLDLQEAAREPSETDRKHAAPPAGESAARLKKPAEEKKLAEEKKSGNEIKPAKEQQLRDSALSGDRRKGEPASFAGIREPATGPRVPTRAAPAMVRVDEKPPEAEEQKRLRPAAWLVSTLAHVAVLLLLGMVTFSQAPRDQLAFTATPVAAEDEAVESFTIEPIESMPEESEAAASDTAVDVDPFGTMPVADVTLDLPAAAAAPMAEGFASSAAQGPMTTASLRSDAGPVVTFAGVEGGGNHFVYLVDSSNSMRNFNEARMELLRSIDSLESHQRFYVVFYDQDPDYMRLSDPNRDEPASVFATQENKLALQRWAMTIQQERGKSPIDVLQFAFGLRPDVIFLLSDGEFSARTEVVIREHNRRTNLFGDDEPISIIHTIRYPGYSAAEARNAEVQMKRIAAENGGQYRNVEIR